MNTLKPLLIVAVLAGVGYGVYVRINSGNDAPPPGIAEQWQDAPRVQLPETAPSGGPPWSSGGIAGGGAPSFPGRGGDAGAANQRGADAPSFPAHHPGHNPGAHHPGMASAADPNAAAPPYGSALPNGAPYGGADPGGAPGGQAAPYDPAVGPGGAASPYANNPTVPGEVPGGAIVIGDPNTPDAARGNPYPYAPSREGDPGAQPPADMARGAGAPPYGDVPERYRDTATANAPIGATGPGAAMDAGSEGGYRAAMESVRRELEAGQMSSALRQLSRWYDNPQLAPADQQQLNQLMDQVAGTVVYSTQHLLELPYEVQPGERLEDIGQRYSVPWQLLAKINGIDDPQTLRPGQRLKVVHGPFSAQVSLEKRQLTLFLNDEYYAGRFNIGIGREHPPQEGVFTVTEKVVKPVYHGAQQNVPAGDPGNPLGQRWIGLGGAIGIHGMSHPDEIARPDLPGSINLKTTDVDDVFDILSVGSKVTVRR